MRIAISRRVRSRLRKYQLPWPARTNPATLFFAPHQDDEAFGCGGLIARRVAAEETVHVVFITDGASSHPGHPIFSPAQIAALRADEARTAAAILGVPADRLHFLNAPDGRLPHLGPEVRASLVENITRLIRLVEPGEVFVTSRHDGSTEHLAASCLVDEALAGMPGPRPRLLEYPIWSRWNPLLVRSALAAGPAVHHLFLSKKEAATKQEAINAYRSQLHPLPPSKNAALPQGFECMFTQPEEFFFEFPNT